MYVLVTLLPVHCVAVNFVILADVGLRVCVLCVVCCVLCIVCCCASFCCPVGCSCF
jgi:hypothetical protein